MYLTSSELNTIYLTAREICGCLWDDVEAVGIKNKLEAVLATIRPGGDADLTIEDCRKLQVLLSLFDESVYMLADSSTNEDIRDATVDELCKSLLAGAEGIILVDGRKCYVETAVSY